MRTPSRVNGKNGWRIERDPGGEVSWFRPDGTGYRAGPLHWAIDPKIPSEPRAEPPKALPEDPFRAGPERRSHEPERGTMPS